VHVCVCDVDVVLLGVLITGVGTGEADAPLEFQCRGPISVPPIKLDVS